MTLEQYTTVKQFAAGYEAGTVSSDFIAASTALTARHVRRVLKALKPPVVRTAWNRVRDEIRENIILEKTDNPYKNCQWISEIVSDRFETRVSQSTVYRILKTAGLLPQEEREKVVRARFEAAKTADLVQMDTTWGYWWGKEKKEKLCLILLLDDYSRFILKAKFVASDTAEANMAMIRAVVEQYGIFTLLYTDNASFFKPIRHGQTLHHSCKGEEDYESEITRACRELGITHITHQPYQPQGKGKIERIFRFIQERFVTEITETDSLQEINEKFHVWMTWYNERHVNRTIRCVPKERFNPDEFQPLPGERNLDDIFCYKDTRKVDKGNCFSYQGVVYTIPKEMCMVAYRISLHVLPGRSIRVWHQDQFICQLPMTPKTTN